MLRRLGLFAVLVYIALDLCVAAIPGAFVFEADQSVESLRVQRGAGVDARMVPPPPTRDPRAVSLPALHDRAVFARGDLTIIRPAWRPPIVHLVPPVSAEEPH
jgi:hypothetical protein